MIFHFWQEFVTESERPQLNRVGCPLIVNYNLVPWQLRTSSLPAPFLLLRGGGTGGGDARL